MSELQSFKCKNCGGIMQAVANEEGVLKCEYCESIFTIPKIDSDAEVLQYLNIGEHGLDTCIVIRLYQLREQPAKMMHLQLIKRQHF